MFGGGSNSSGSKTESEPKPEGRSPSPESNSSTSTPVKSSNQAASGEKRCGNGSPQGRNDSGGATDKKRRGSGVGSKASSFLASARNSLSFSQSGRGNSEPSSQTPLQKLGKQDPALAVPQGQQNNSAGESLPGPRSTFRVGVWEDRNKKCRRTMEDTHAFLYNFLDTPASATDGNEKDEAGGEAVETSHQEMVQSDNGYFAIFDGHAGTFAADWCGKKLHIVLEDIVRKYPNAAIPELLDRTFTTVDAHLEKLPLKNSGCTAAIAVLRWEDRVPCDRSATGSMPIAPAAAASAKAAAKSNDVKSEQDIEATAAGSDAAIVPPTDGALSKLKASVTRQRVLYTANVGDARIILCRGGKALRLSYDHKGSDENEGKRISNAGGLILNNRVNGVLAVTRALGDAYLKSLVTGHPYTTETVIQTDVDEFIIIACDGLWDVCSDQEAVDLVRNVQDPTAASKLLVDHALSRFSTDNLSCMIVRFDREAASQKLDTKNCSVEPDGSVAKISEVEKIVMDTKQKIADGCVPAVGVSASSSSRKGNEPEAAIDEEFVPTTLDGTLEEEPAATEKDEVQAATACADADKAAELKTDPEEKSNS